MKASTSAAASAMTTPSAPWPPRLSSARSRALACRQPPPAPSRPLPSVAASRGAVSASKGSNSTWNAPPFRPFRSKDDGKPTTRAAASSSSSSSYSYSYRPDDYASAFDDEGTQFGTTGINSNTNDPSSENDRPPSLWRRALAAAAEAASSPAAAAAAQVGQTAASLLFVVLYVWSTYSSPPPGGFRQLLDAGLCFVFAADYMIRLAVSSSFLGFWGGVGFFVSLFFLISLCLVLFVPLTHLPTTQRAESKVRMICSFWNILDALAVFPPLIELFVGGGGASSAAAAAAAAASAPRSSRARASLGTLRGSSFDFRWFKALRALRVMRVALLAGELGSMHASSSGRLLASAASVRLFQLVASVATLLFTTSAVVNLVERMPFHDALYFVTTTLTTVGYGDVVVKSTAGKFAVLVMILLGVIIIPAQSSALWAQLQARRVTLGPLPAQWRKQPHVLVSARLSDVRGFSDFLMEFFAAGARAAAAAVPADGEDGRGTSGGGGNADSATAASRSLRASSSSAASPLLEAPLPRNARMVVLGGKPDFEFRALQELNDRRLTLVEGSALSERDLARTRAEAAAGVLLLADRFSPSPSQEDLNVLFQVWAVKSYTRSPRLYVQVLQRRSLQAVRPFLDPSRDVLVSVEQTRHRLLALSALCPGASTLLANLLRRAAVPPPPPLPGQLQQKKGGGGGGGHGSSGGKSSVDAAASPQQRRTAGGRRWLRSYMNGCGNKIHVVRLATPSLAGVPFADAAAAMHAATGVLMIGVMRGGGGARRPSPSPPGAAASSSASASSSSSSSAAVAGTVLNPGRRLLRGGDSAVVICATGAAGARAAAALDYSEWLLRLPGRGGGEAARGRSGGSFSASNSSSSKADASPFTSSSIDYVAASASESLDPSASVDGDASAAAAAAAAAIALGSLRAGGPEGWGAAATLARWARAPFDLVGGVAAAVVGAVAPERKARREEEKRRRRKAALAVSAAAASAAAAGAAKRSKTSGGAASSSSWGSDDADTMPPPPEGVDCASVPVETESVDWEEGECDVESLLPKGDGDGGGVPVAAAQSPATSAEQPNPAKATKGLGSPALSTSSFDDSAGYVDDDFYFAAERPRGSKEAAAAAKSSAAEPAATTAAAASAAAEGGAISSSPSTSPLLPPPKPRFSNHIIIAGADASFLAFAEQVRASDPLASTTPLVILSAYRPSDLGAIAALGGPVFWIRGDAASAEGLSAAAAASARALVYLALPQRPGGGEGIGSLGGGGSGMGAGQRGGPAEGGGVSSSMSPRSSSSPGGVVVQPDGRVAFVPGAAPSSPSDAASSSSSSTDKGAAWASIAASAPFEDPSLPSAAVAAGAGDAIGGGEAASGRADRAAASRSAVLADAPGLLCCYGAGEVDGSATPPYAVIELCFTSSLRFLQPGLLLKGVSAGVPSDDFGWRKRGYSANSSAAAAASSAGSSSSSSYSFNNTSAANHAPRRSWLARKRQEKAAAAEGLAAWQANPYYAAGRVTVPAGMDAFACAGFFGGAGLLPDIMAELAGDDGRPGGAALRSVPVPPQLVGATYGSLFARFAGRRRLVPLGLYRRKSENATWRLSYVVTNPPPGTRLERGDRVFVLRERGGPWLAGPSADDDDSQGFFL